MNIVVAPPEDASVSVCPRAATINDSFSFWNLPEDWRAILDAEGAERAVLCGLSMGAMTALRLALAAPERPAYRAMASAALRLTRRDDADLRAVLA